MCCDSWGHRESDTTERLHFHFSLSQDNLKEKWETIEQAIRKSKTTNKDIVQSYLGFLIAQLVKNLPAIWTTRVGKIPWRRKRLPTTVFWPGEFHGLYSSWGCKESDTTKRLSLTFTCN